MLETQTLLTPIKDIVERHGCPPPEEILHITVYKDVS